MENGLLKMPDGRVLAAPQASPRNELNGTLSNSVIYISVSDSLFSVALLTRRR